MESSWFPGVPLMTHAAVSCHPRGKDIFTDDLCIQSMVLWLFPEHCPGMQCAVGSWHHRAVAGSGSEPEPHPWRWSGRADGAVGTVCPEPGPEHEAHLPQPCGTGHSKPRWVHATGQTKWSQARHICCDPIKGGEEEEEGSNRILIFTDDLLRFSHNTVNHCCKISKNDSLWSRRWTALMQMMMA